MRKLMFALVVLLFSHRAWCEDIVDVLRRSQDMRLAAMPAADIDNPRVAVVRASFERLMREMPPGTAADVRVIRGPLMAETLHGHIVVANELLGDLPESARMFVLAHELGHVVENHWLQMALVFQKWVPGEVTQEQTDAVAASLGHDASELAYRQEFEADAFAANTLHHMGWSQDDMLSAFMHLGIGAGGDTATHPGVRKRIAVLRAMNFAGAKIEP